MSGIFVAIVGPSGVGKDSLLRFAQDRLGDKITLVRRVVTRSADGNGEEHDSLSEEAFRRAEQDGAFALSWSAHGLSYGLPVSLEDDLARGQIVLANLSRRVIPQLMRLYPDAVVVSVTADRDVIAERLHRRGRETPESVEARLSRTIAGDPLLASTIVIDNSGALEVAGERLVRLLQDMLGVSA